MVLRQIPMGLKSFAELDHLLNARQDSLGGLRSTSEVLQQQLRRAIDEEQGQQIKELIAHLETRMPRDVQQRLFAEAFWRTVETNKVQVASLLIEHGARIPLDRLALLNRIANSDWGTEQELMRRAWFVHLLFERKTIEQLAWIYKAARNKTVEFLQKALTNNLYNMEDTWVNIVLVRDHERHRAVGVIALWLVQPEECETVLRTSAAIINLKKYTSVEELILRPRLQTFAHALSTIEGSATVAFSVDDIGSQEQSPIPLDDVAWQRMATWPELQKLNTLTDQIKPNFTTLDVDPEITYALADTANKILKCNSDEQIWAQLDKLENVLFFLVG